MDTLKEMRIAIQDGIDRFKDFSQGNVKGKKWTTNVPPGTGRLPEDLARVLKKIAEDGDLEYIIYSFQTPIAWKTRGMSKWFVPPTKYSNTTTHHQSVVKVAIAHPNFYYSL